MKDAKGQWSFTVEGLRELARLLSKLRCEWPRGLLANPSETQEGAGVGAEADMRDGARQDGVSTVGLDNILATPCKPPARKQHEMREAREKISKLRFSK